MIEKILREETNNIFSDEWYKKVSRKISVEKTKEIDSEIVNIFNKIKRASNQYNGEWLTIFEILDRTHLEIGNQKLGQILSKKGFTHKISRKNGGNPVKRYYVRLLQVSCRSKKGLYRDTHYKPANIDTVGFLLIKSRSQQSMSKKI